MLNNDSSSTTSTVEKNHPLSWDSLFVILIILSVISIPLKIKIHNSILILTVLVYFFTLVKQKIAFNWVQTFYFIGLTSFFWLSLISVTYSENLRYALSKMETRLPILVWPIIILLNPIFKKRKNVIDLILNSFVISTIVFCFYCHCAMMEKLQTLGLDINQFFLHYELQTSYLSEPLKLHPTYFSLFIILSIFVLFKRLPNQKPGRRIVIILIIIYLLVFVLQLSARGPILALALISLLLSTVLIIKGKKYIYGIVIIALTLFLLYFAFTRLENFRHKFYLTFKEFIENKDKIVTTNSVTLHYRSWLCSIETSKNNLPLGTGIGDGLGSLIECYSRSGWEYMAAEGLNAHCQYLSMLVDLGIPGLLSFILLLVVLVVVSVKKNDPLLLSFLLLSIIAFIPESVLETQKGVTFFYFFLSILLRRHL